MGGANDASRRVTAPAACAATGMASAVTIASTARMRFIFSSSSLAKHHTRSNRAVHHVVPRDPDLVQLFELSIEVTFHLIEHCGHGAHRVVQRLPASTAHQPVKARGPTRPSSSADVTMIEEEYDSSMNNLLRLCRENMTKL